MAQENNQKNVINPGGQKEEKDFLAHEEVKTMEKDVSQLREIEARRERDRLAQIKTAEEIAREKEREKLAERSSLERDLAEKEAREREERIIKMREARAAEEKALNQARTEKAETATGEFQGALRETQAREEEARKRFLDRVEAQAEGRGEAPIPPPVPPTLPVAEEKAPEIPVKKPGSGGKLWIRIVLSLLVLAIIAGIATFGYWYFVIRGKSENTANPVLEHKELVIPTPLFNADNTQILKISETSEIPSLLSRSLEIATPLNSVNRILVEDTVNTKVLGLMEVFDSFGTAPPGGFYDKLANDATFFVYSQEEGNRFGLVAKINNQEGLADIMTSWEGTMEGSFQSLFELMGKNGPAIAPNFKDAQYQETTFRYQTFNREDLGIVYTIFDNYFILTTSWKSMEKALDKLREAPMSRFFLPPANGGGVEFVLANMSLAGKIGQLFFIGINGTTLTTTTEELIKEVRPGGILLLKKNIVDEDQTKKLVEDLQQVALKNYGIPLFIGVDQEGGVISPVNFIQEKTAQSEIKTADQAYAVGLNRGEELKALGINLNLAPVLDVAQPGDFVFNRAFQTTSSETNALVKALISGQKTASILTAVKHFPGYGDIAFDPEDELATLDKTPRVTLFEKAAEAKPEFVMTSNVIYSEIDPNLPFSFSEKGIALLKKDVGSDPLIMTDDLPQQSLIDRFALKGVVTLPIKAGADILTFSLNWETTLPAAVRILEEAVQTGEISQARIDDSVLKIIELKKAYYQHE